MRHECRAAHRAGRRANDVPDEDDIFGGKVQQFVRDGRLFVAKIRDPDQAIDGVCGPSENLRRLTWCERQQPTREGSRVPPRDPAIKYLTEKILGRQLGCYWNWTSGA